MDVEINYWAVLAATVATYIVGWLWHSVLFGKMWMKLSGISKDSMKDMSMTATKAVSYGFVVTLISTFVLAHFAVIWGAIGVSGAFSLAFWVWFGFIMTTLAGGWLWEGKSFKLFAFNAAHAFVSIFVASLVLVALW